MYKELIKRKLARIIQASESSFINSPAIPKSYQRFDENKKKEVIVFIRQQPGLDKFQIIDLILNKFNTSKEDAERLYYEAYPDGLSSQEEELLEHFDQILPPDYPQLVDNSFAVLLQDESAFPCKDINLENIDPEILQLFIDFIQTLLSDRKLI